MDGGYNSSFTKKESLMMNFIGVVSAICLVISIFGIYSLTSYSMQTRRREIAIRKVMGAKRLRYYANVF